MSRKSQNVINYRQRLKKALVIAFGDVCCCCGTKDYDEVYDFHHINPEEKKFTLGSGRTNHTKAEVANEAKKCCMTCANCHRKLTSGRYNIENFDVIKFDEKAFFDYLAPIKRIPPSKEIIDKQHSKKVSRELLKDYIRKYSFLECGRKCDVSDNAIRKWCKSYGLPHQKSVIDTISDEDWENI